jgi:hypothetical protein
MCLKANLPRCLALSPRLPSSLALQSDSTLLSLSHTHLVVVLPGHRVRYLALLLLSRVVLCYFSLRRHVHFLFAISLSLSRSPLDVKYGD